MAKKKLPVIAKGMKELETWKGRLIVINPDKSEIAKKIGITVKGEYAIKCR